MLDSICCPYLLITCKCSRNMRILISDLMAKHCKLYLKILLTFLVPSIVLSFRLSKRADRKKRSEWWHQHGLSKSRRTHVPSLFSVFALLLCTFYPSAFARDNFSFAWGNSSNSNTFGSRFG